MSISRKKIRMVISFAIVAVSLVSIAFAGCKTTAQEPTTGEEEEMMFEDTELVIQGSDTLLEVSQNWAEAFIEKYPDVNVSITGGGSGTGIAALLNGTVDLANASRAIKDSELDEAEANGLDVQEHIVAWDGISVVINKDNPIVELSIEQLSKIFTGETTNWSEVGGNDADIVVTSRDSSSGTHVYFKERIVQLDETAKENDYTQLALFLVSNSAIKEEVAVNENAVGYIGLGYLDDSVKAVSVIAEDSSEGVAPSIENVQNKTYPISRPLYIYAPDADLTDLEQAYLDFVLGSEGQAIALDIGFVPLS